MILILYHLLKITLLSSMWSALANLCAFENILHSVAIECIIVGLFNSVSLCFKIGKAILFGAYKLRLLNLPF